VQIFPRSSGHLISPDSAREKLRKEALRRSRMNVEVNLNMKKGILFGGLKVKVIYYK